MKDKDKQFHMRLNASEQNALEQMAKRAGISKAQYVRQFIRRSAKKKKIPIWP